MNSNGINCNSWSFWSGWWISPKGVGGGNLVGNQWRMPAAPADGGGGVVEVEGELIVVALQPPGASRTLAFRPYRVSTLSRFLLPLLSFFTPSLHPQATRRFRGNFSDRQPLQLRLHVSIGGWDCDPAVAPPRKEDWFLSGRVTGFPFSCVPLPSFLHVTGGIAAGLNVFQIPNPLCPITFNL